MNTLFKIVFGGCDMELYIKNPERAKELLKQNREERGLSFKQVLVKRQKDFDKRFNRISGVSKAMRGQSDKRA